MRIGPADARRHYTNSGAPAELIKYPQTFDPHCPIFTGGKISQILAQISTPVVFGPPSIWTATLYRQTKTNLSRADDRTTIIPNLGWVCPQLPEPLAELVPQRVKVENFLYILRSSASRRVHRHQCYTTCWGRNWRKKSTCHISQFAPYISQGAKISSPY